MLAAIRGRFYALVRDRKGQSTTEYILILAVVVMIAMKFRDQIAGQGGILERILGNVSSQLEGFAGGGG